MIRLLLLTLGLFISVCSNGQEMSEDEITTFEKDKWLSSSAYRYEIAKSDKFPSFSELSKSKIIEILGNPDFEKEKMMTYCFDIRKDDSKEDKCNGSYLIINLDKNLPEKFRLTFAWVEK